MDSDEGVDESLLLSIINDWEAALLAEVLRKRGLPIDRYDRFKDVNFSISFILLFSLVYFVKRKKLANKGRLEGHKFKFYRLLSETLDIIHSQALKHKIRTLDLSLEILLRASICSKVSEALRYKGRPKKRVGLLEHAQGDIPKLKVVRTQAQRNAVNKQLYEDVYKIKTRHRNQGISEIEAIRKLFQDQGNLIGVEFSEIHIQKTYAKYRKIKQKLGGI